jgi:hypothetical protein
MCKPPPLARAILLRVQIIFGCGSTISHRLRTGVIKQVGHVTPKAQAGGTEGKRVEVPAKGFIISPGRPHPKLEDPLQRPIPLLARKPPITPLLQGCNPLRGRHW